MMVSVIVLVYNSEKHIERCVRSILSQTYRDFELLLIDDDSSDNSLEICRRLGQNDSRIFIFERSHSGISANREFGLQQAKGDYVLYVDSDDWIESNMLEVLVSQAEHGNYDIVSCGFVCEYKDHSQPMIRDYESKEEYLRAVICNDWGVLWKNLIKRTLFVDYNIHFPLDVDGGEDYVVVSKLLYHCNQVTFNSGILYHYNCNNSNSFISTSNLQKIFYQIRATKIIESFFEEKGCIEEYNNELRQRKTYVKAPLKEIDYKLWRSVFPEVNYYIDLDNDGKIKAFVRKVLHKLMEML